MILSDHSGLSASADVCIVGAGPVGLALAFKLEQLGCSVLVLEGGPAVSDFPAIEFSSSNHAQQGAAVHRGIGGTSALWGGRCVGLDDIDFESREHVSNSGWPLAHSCVSRHYSEALRFLQAGSLPLETIDDEAEAFTLNAVERWSRTPDLAPLCQHRLSASQKITVALEATVTEVILDDDGARVKALRLNDREDFVAPGKVVLAAGGLETARLLLALQKKHPAALGGPEGALGRFYQGHLTGYLALVHLDDQDLVRSLSFALDMQGYRYRARLQPSAGHQTDERLLNIVFWLDPISISDPVHRSGSLSFLYLVLKLSGTYRRLSRGLAPRSGARKKGEFWSHLKNIRLRGVSPARALRMLNHIWHAGERGPLASPSGRYLLRYHAEQAPNPASRVTLRDGEGATPILRVDYRVEEQDVLSVLRAHHLLDQWLREKGSGSLEYLHPDSERSRSVLAQAFDGYHQIGLARMSDDPDRGVVDPNCRVHQIDNLFVAGASVFPTGGQANPTLPAVALAHRLAEHLACLVKEKEGVVAPAVDQGAGGRGTE